MSNSLAFFSDPGMTMAMTRMEAYQSSDGASAPVEQVVYLGSPVSGKKFRDAAAPGTGQIVLSVVDAAGGAQLPAASVRLALSAGGLASATPGAALPVGVEILSGAGNSTPVHVRIDTAAQAAAVYDNLSLAVSPTLEEPV
mgnify:CR=1 FL=1